MRSITKNPTFPRGLFVAIAFLIVAVFSVFLASRASADTLQPTGNERLITVHDGDGEKSFLTRETTLRNALKDAKIRIDPSDRVEPSLDSRLVAAAYEINIYRARPVMIVDGGMRQKVMTPYRTGRQIADQAHVTLHDEDKLTMTADGDIVRDGSSLQLTIDRATEFTLKLYGKKMTAYTQAKTVADMLSEKKITLGEKDQISLVGSTPMTAGITVEVWRNGKQTFTQEEPIVPPVRQIQDADQPVGYKKVQTEGKAGKKSVTYEVIMKNGKEVSRKEIQSVMLEKAEERVEIVGSKPNFNGDFAAALAKLRSCEGGYNSWNPAGPYYGAYQFDRGTWSSYAPAGAVYGSASPAEQDQAARNAYLARGWQPWPVCASGLPDTYR